MAIGGAELRAGPGICELANMGSVLVCFVCGRCDGGCSRWVEAVCELGVWLATVRLSVLVLGVVG